MRIVACITQASVIDRGIARWRSLTETNRGATLLPDSGHDRESSIAFDRASRTRPRLSHDLVDANHGYVVAVSLQ